MKSSLTPMLPSFLDKSDTHLLTLLGESATAVAGETHDNFLKLATDFVKDSWFAARLKKEDLVSYLQYSVEGQENLALQALLDSFQTPGTLFSILGLIRAIFGQEAKVTLNQGAGTLTLDIVNANEAFLWGFRNIPRKGEDPVGLVDRKGRGILFRFFNILGDHNLQSFFYSFIPVGVVLMVRLLGLSSQTAIPGDSPY